MSTRSTYILDFETHGIETRPDYPPKPVGVAISGPDVRPEYLAWGHPLENNTTEADARRRLKALWTRSDVELVFHNGKFDVDVAETHLKLPAPAPHRYHDTLFLAFLADPHSPSLSLKPLAERYLKMPSTERDAVRDWLVANVDAATASNFGAYISRAPGRLVGKYAIGDIVRTAKLFKKLHADVSARDMLGAYDRERKLMPILLRNERRGIRVHHERLRRDVRRYGGTPSEDGVYRGGVIGEIDARIRKMLRAKELDVDKKEELANALDRAGKMTSWKTTKTGKRSVAKDSLLEGLGDKKLMALLLYRGAVATCVRTFMAPWLRMADATGGIIHTNWNQVRQSHREGPADAGARTGRLSSNPNFQNIPTTSSPNYERIVKLLKAEKLLEELAPFPLVRSYIAADDGDAFIIDRDYSQQELRILGHYEDAVLCDRYNADPWLDVHDTARELINGMLGTEFIRRVVKDISFGLIYGMGLDKLALKIEQDAKTTKTVRDAYLTVFPGLGDLNKNLKWRAIEGKPIRTWGGREYHVEPPKFSKKYGRMQTFDYKLLNVLIQGSAADNTKQALINYEEHPKRRHGRFMLTVHDEILASAPKRAVVAEMNALREAMEDVPFDVPMLSEGEYGTDWANLKPFDAKGKMLYRGRT